MFKQGDYVRNKQDEKCRLLNQYFNGYYKRVIRVEDNNISYAGYQLVYVELDNKEQGFYAAALEKL